MARPAQGCCLRARRSVNSRALQGPFLAQTGPSGMSAACPLSGAMQTLSKPDSERLICEYPIDVPYNGLCDRPALGQLTFGVASLGSQAHQYGWRVASRARRNI